MRSSTNVTQRVVRGRQTQPVPLRSIKPVRVPFSSTGIIAVLACPALLFLDISSGAHIMIGTFSLIMLTLLGEQRRTMIALFATVAVVTLVIDLRLFYGQPGTELAVMDKVIALIALPLLAWGLIHKRNVELQKQRRKPVCNVRIVPALAERVAMIGESKTAFRHMRRSKEPLDEYTRALIWFVYIKSPKN